MVVFLWWNKLPESGGKGVEVNRKKHGRIAWIKLGEEQTSSICDTSQVHFQLNQTEFNLCFFFLSSGNF